MAATRAAARPRWRGRLYRLGPLAVTLLSLSACGGDTSHRHPASGPSTIRLLMASGPNSLDPAVGTTPEALEADWLVYTPLLSYVRSTGTPGTRLVPALAEQQPTVSNGGTLYTLTLRSGLHYSNGQPVRAGDFAWAVERAIRLWPEAPRLITHRIVGAAAFAAHRARTISGISTDDATGQITIRLIRPYGPLGNVLALPALAPVPTGTPFRDLQSPPPPGVGAYELARVVPGKSFSLVRNPGWAKLKIPWVTPGHVDIDVTVTGNAETNALAVLGDRADVFDWADQIPPGLATQIERKAARRYSLRVRDDTYLIFLNVNRRPFSSQLAREAVRAGLDQTAMGQLAPTNLLNGCYLLPPTLYGHPHDACPDGNRAGDGNLSTARQLVQRSGMGGARVIVWSEADAPAREWMSYYATLLNQIGFRASLRLLAPNRYYGAIGNLRTHPQTGFASLDEFVPNPVQFYRPLTGRAIKTARNKNWSEVNDPYVNTSVRVLAAVPATTLSAVANFWQQLELYVADKAYVAVIGYPRFPLFVSDRIKFRALQFSPVVGYDWSSFRLK